MKRSYEQYCAVAKALDVVGERWTLLIVRELFLGPQRFSDLLQTLPGMGNGLLATKLREMQDVGLIETAELPPPAASRVYQLTPLGYQLDEAVTALARWGSGLLGPLDTEAHRHPLWFLQSLAARTGSSSTYPPELAKLDIDVHIDGQRHHLRVRRGRVITRRGPHPQPQAVITVTSQLLYEINRNEIRLEDAIDDGRMGISGDQEAGVSTLRALLIPGNSHFLKERV